MKQTIEDSDIVFYGTYVLTEIHSITTLIRANKNHLLLPEEGEQVFEVHRHRSSDGIIELYRHTAIEEHVATLVNENKEWSLTLPPRELAQV